MRIFFNSQTITVRPTKVSQVTQFYYQNNYKCVQIKLLISANKI